MKFIKRSLTLVMVLTMLVSIVAIPTMAYTTLPTVWVNHIASFPEIRKNVDRYTYYDYIMALQRYLMCFDYVCQRKLYYNGGYMDGDFGGRTETAVIYLQEQFGYTGKQIDGAVGPQTWGSIARSMKLYTENYDRIRRLQGVPGQWVFIIGDSDGNDYLAYFDETNINTKGI